MIDIRQRLTERHVSPAIIERVLRLNPTYTPGVRLRGIHYKGLNDPGLWWGFISKGECIRRFGRAWFQAVPRHEIRKYGKRVYVRREYVEDCAPLESGMVMVLD